MAKKAVSYLKIVILQNLGGGHDVVGCPITGLPCGSAEGVVDFPSTPHLPPTNKNSCHNTRRAAAILMVGG